MSSSSFVRPSRWLRHWWPLSGLGLAVLFVLGIVTLAWWIQISAREMGTTAMKEFPGDRVEALGAMAQSERHKTPDALRR